MEQALGPFNFSHGLISGRTPFNQPKNSLSELQNLRIWRGSLVERPIAGVYTSSQIPGTGNLYVQGLYANQISGNSAFNHPVLCVVDGKIYKVDSAGTATDISGAVAFNPAGAEQNYSNADQLNGIMIIGDPSNSTGMVQWNDTGNCTAVTGPTCNVVRTVNNFMFATAVGSSRVYWSNVGDPTNWNGSNNFIDYRLSDGDVMADLHYIGTDLYIFKRRSIGRLSTLTTTISGAVTLGPLQTVAVGIGAAGPGCVQKLPDGRLIFAGSDSRAYIFDGSVLTDISVQANGPDVLETFYNNAPATVAQGTRVCVYPPRDEAWFVYTQDPSTNGNPYDYALVYNYKDNNWSLQHMVGTVTAAGLEHASQLIYVPATGTGYAFPSAAPYQKIGTLISGYRGMLHVHDPTANGGTNRNVSPDVYWGTSIYLQSEGRTFYPRSLILFHKTTSVSFNNYTFTYAFDGGTLGNSTTITLSTSYARTVIPIKCPSGAFSTMQFRVACGAFTDGLTTFESFYLSGEYMN